MNEYLPVTIVGAGVVGLNIANELASIPKYKEGIFVLEKSHSIGDGQSGRNSGVIHAGIYYKQGSLKARFCVEGNKKIKQYASIHGIPWDNNGKLIVAVHDDEIPILEQLVCKGVANGIRESDLEIISGSDVQKVAPNIQCVAALYSKTTGIIDVASYHQRLKENAIRNGVSISFESEVTRVQPEKNYVEFDVKHRDGNIETYRTELFINAAGLYADKIAHMINPQFKRRISPVRGEYATFKITRPDIDIAGINIYPIPISFESDGRLKTSLGIHLTPTYSFDPSKGIVIGNEVIVGPAAVPVEDRENYNRHRLPLEIFYGKIKQFFPNIRQEDLVLGNTGILAKLENEDDFIFEVDQNHPNCVQIVGSESPFLTGSPMAGIYLREILDI